jgi:hypothetical protein
VGTRIRLVEDHPEIVLSTDSADMLELWERMLRENGIINVAHPNGGNIAFNPAHVVSMEAT